MNNTIKIGDLKVLTKTANTLTISGSLQLFSDDINVNASLNFSQVDETSPAQMYGREVFNDNFVIKKADLPSDVTLEEAITNYVAAKFGATILPK